MFPVEVRVFVECNQCPHPEAVVAPLSPPSHFAALAVLRAVQIAVDPFLLGLAVLSPRAEFRVAYRVGVSLSTETTAGELPNFGVPTSDAPLLCTQPGRLLIKASSLLEPSSACRSALFELVRLQQLCMSKAGVIGGH
eukprot:s5285_g2.t1